ncbi:MAG: MATE family efflux transporter [Clostridia bacterium]|nr:MATE family efflux transporter [Clostridia bacterium]
MIGGRTQPKTDFSQGPVWRRILDQAGPLIVAQLVHLLYNVVDRIYLGHMGDGGGMALTGVGLTFPIVTLIMGFAALFGTGGVPLFSIARGAGDEARARRILGNSFTLQLVSSALLMVVGYLFMRPILFAFGASEDSFVYAKAYLDVYLVGTAFSMIATGLNGYINAQGFPRIGMLSIVIGAAANIALDPVFIFALGMGVKGAALATVISQGLSALWVLRFLTGQKAIIPLKRENMAFDGQVVRDIAKLGTANFIMQGTTCLVQIACNATLQQFGGDLYVGVMTVVNSVREIFLLPVNGITSGSQPVISYNYGARRYDRVLSGIRFNTLIGAGYTLVAWLLVLLLPRLWFGIFSDDPAMTEAGVEALRIYFFGFVCMALQFAGQSAFTALGDAPHAILFSLLRKAIIVVPLTLLLPRLGFGVKGVFLAEPVSNAVGGTACYLTMRLTQLRRIRRLAKQTNGKET